MRAIAFLPLCAALACAHHAGEDVELAPAASASGEPAAPANSAPKIRAQLNGRAFPDGVLALTWDDGPDARTLELAQYLHREHVSATFFVVGAWTRGVSSDPGFGARVEGSGWTKLPLLGELVALGHRVGNHTMHHVLLGRAKPDVAARELEDAQRGIDPFVRDEVRFFRAPGGDWSASASRAVDADPYLANLVGPVRWDVDAKDWEGAVWCEASPRQECEHEHGQWRVRADVMAERYERAIASAGRGIVLMHDRVGDVGSRYALDIAERLVPWLESRGYVFAAPVLGFGPASTRWARACTEMKLGDLDGDGRDDACAREGDEIVCAKAASQREDGVERASFEPDAPIVATLPPRTTSFELADVDGDGRADVCATTPAGIACALARRAGGLGAFEPWSSDFQGAVRFADVDGDGRADVCAPAPSGVVCARSTGASFEPARVWLASTFAASIALGDLDGDGRADLCAPTTRGVFCALSRRASFGRFSRWSAEKLAGPLAMGDLNGDGRADVCAGGSCALSNGHALTGSVAWLDEDPTVRAEWGPLASASLGDINGDGRTDICGCDASGVRCAVAP